MIFTNLYLAAALLSGEPSLTVSIDVDFGRDNGANLGTLFEVSDATGNVIAGAGYLGAYSTESRIDRRKLNFFLKSLHPVTSFVPERLPRANDDAGVYLFDFDGRLFARSRADGKDTRLRVWNDTVQQWDLDAATPLFPVSVAAGALTVASKSVSYQDHSILELGPADGRIGENYYANGWFVFRQLNLEATPPHSELVATRWSPDGSTAINLSQALSLNMRTPGEFVYAFGQLDEHVFAATNTGGVYSFDGKNWRVWREPSPGVSFQIYSIINFEDRLLMGQYPTGHLFEFDGTHFGLLENQPPVMKGVSRNAREAQTLAIYGGDLYAGVWPWGEVWKFDRRSREWQLAGRVFSHPEPTDATTHPYEIETKMLDPVLNRWGQRVTGLVPHGESMFISTSAKSSNPFEPKFTFLTGDKWKDYGAVYRVRQPGNLAVQTQWTTGPTRFEFTIGPDRVTIRQDGKELGTTKLEGAIPKSFADAKVEFGKGVYGKLRGTIKATTTESASGER